jgi:ribose transport system ATP-binding protein
LTATVQTTSAVLGLTNISKSFPGVRALKDVSFEAVGGQVHALVGENGAGKSTLMGVASGSIARDAGVIAIGNRQVDTWNPILAQQQGLAIVYQHPALLPDMTVQENIEIALPDKLAGLGRARAAWMRDQLERVGCTAKLSTRVEDITVAQRQLLELAKAMASDPRILILDEPTAPLGSAMVERVFEQVRAAAERGTAVVYISHRLPEVREIAEIVTVMRDGEVKATSRMDAISDDEILRLIIGRTVDTAFPPKAEPPEKGGAPVLSVQQLSGNHFQDVTLEALPGEILGIAGIAGNGQSEFLRTLAGLERVTSGGVALNGRSLKPGQPSQARREGVTYLSADRHHEGLQMSLSVRENAALMALPRLSTRGVVRRAQEAAEVQRQGEALNIKAASLETGVSTLSGGNQQKVVLARSLLAQPSLILADEPTQGVDAGARMEIYRILRDVADSGVVVLINSSDLLELQGLCDRVAVFSRGHLIETLAGEDVTEERIARTIVTATAHRKHVAGTRDASKPSAAFVARAREFAKGDYAPAVILLLAMIVFGLYTYNVNELVTSAFNIESALMLLAALAFVSLGQTAVILTGGIDISVGPLVGLLVVLASFFVNDGKSAMLTVFAFALMLFTAVSVGAVNGSLVRFVGFTPIAATLTIAIALQGLSLLLRGEPGGFIRTDVTDVITTKIGVVPVAFIIALVLAVGMELALRYTRWGLNLRAAGSEEVAARRLGVHVNRTVVGAYVVCGLCCFLGGVMLMAQLGIGDPAQGTTYTLASVTAVVLGGTSLFGGRGSFIGALLGAALVQQIINATTFLSLSQAWQYWLTGLLTLAAAAAYTQVRRAGQLA